MQEDPLKALLVKKVDNDRAILADALRRFVRLDDATGAPVLLEDFAGLSQENRILAILLARKAAVTLGLLKEPEPLTPKGIATQAGINYDSVKPTVSSMFKKKIVDRKDGAYFVQDSRVLIIKRLLTAQNAVVTR